MAGSARPEPDDLGERIVDHPGGEIIGEEMGAIPVFLLAPSKMVERKKTEKMLAKMEDLFGETIWARTMPR